MKRAPPRRPQQPRRTPTTAPTTSPTTQATQATVTIEKLVPGGHGLARDDDGVFFVDGVAAGEVVEVAIAGKKGGARRARLLRVIEPSVERVTPDCPLFGFGPGRCGGCDWLHLSRAAQTAGKEQIVDDALVRVGRFAAADVARFRRPLLVPPPGEKRRRARFVVDGAGRLTLSRRDSNERVVIPACPAVDPRISALLTTLAAGSALPPGSEVRLAVDDAGVHAGVDRRGSSALAALPGVLGVVVDGAVDAGAVDGGADGGADVVIGEVTAGAFAARSDALTFTQATRFGGAAIRDTVLRGAGDVPGGPHGGLRGQRVLELFAGSGHLTLPLAQAGADVDAVEGDPRALRWLQRNVDDAGLRVRVRRAYIDDALDFSVVDVVVADPPRTGIPGAAGLFARFARMGVTRLILVSCDPATGARDLRAAVDAGFVIDDVTPIDAFPRTHHTELVAVLRRP